MKKTTEQSQAEFIEILSKIKGLSFESWLEDVSAPIVVQDAWGRFSPLSSKPISVIDVESSQVQIDTWFKACEASMNIKDTFYIAFGATPWAKVEITDASLFSFKLLWESLEPKDFLVLNHKNLFCFFEEEYTYEFFEASVD